MEVVKFTLQPLDLQGKAVKAERSSLHFWEEKPDSQCTYNVTLSSVRVTIVSVKKK
jgi:hypothetical protein